ncbi:hypothetical protein PUNSTDRAFT_136655 [Punctularia strigosozonata HHB-11173 SS5]|uniref:uncharacterized protein n=1 Tax=Punctularia strigosozonata (strain HHB-11173) TaxID=741275 RepID=UPI0004416F9D|nr:uncharacterized protein PUNSTDRAFT_136655 [Punctularia strigosozonata HHB-11173 SS5]EIN06823.1 hypothetical protein PUNSTDRAFT_136655 [Punctularia strigosozonata HHB-11173 SS5]
MSASEEPHEEKQETKPKINVVVDFQGQQTTIKVKVNTPFSKIFDAIHKKFGKESGHFNVSLRNAPDSCPSIPLLGTLKFVYDGVRVNPDDTPAALELEDGDVVDAHLQQGLGSFRVSRI